MRKLLLLLFLFSTIFSYATTISGTTEVCPNQAYTYTFKFGGSADTEDYVSIKVDGGKFNETGTNEYYSKITGGQTLKLDITWEDKFIVSGNYIYALPTSLSSGTLKVKVATMKDLQPRGFRSSIKPEANSPKIRIPYGISGQLSMSVYDDYYYNFNNNTSYKITKFSWKIGNNSSEGSNTYNLAYGMDDLDGTTITITPIGEACDTKTYGKSITYTIERYWDLSLSARIQGRDELNPCIACQAEKVVHTLNGYIPQGAKISWKPKGCIIVTSESTEREVTSIVVNKGYKAEMYTIVSLNNKQDTIKLKNPIWVGLPDTPSVSESGQQFMGNTYYSLSGYANGASELNWSISGSIHYTMSDGRILTKNEDGSFDITLTGSNRCGTGPTFKGYGIVKTRPGDPGVEPPINEKMKKEVPLAYEIVRVYNTFGKLVYKNEGLKDFFDITQINIPRGIYIIEKVEENGDRSVEKINY